MIEMLTVDQPETPKGREIRELTPEEIQSVKYVFDAVNQPIPVPSTFIGAVENGKVLGFLVLQVKAHAEPMWIEPGHSELFKPIVAEAEKTILKKCGPTWIYLFAPAGRVSQLAQSMGMQLEPWNVLSKLIMPEAPAKLDPFLSTLAEMPVEGEVI